MKSKLVFLLFFISISIAGFAIKSSGRVMEYRDSVKLETKPIRREFKTNIENIIMQIWMETTHIRKESNVKDSLFLSVLDTLSRYAIDEKFSEAKVESNLNGLFEFLTVLHNRDLPRDEKCTDMLRYGFSVMEWRKDGTLYDQLWNYSRFSMKCASFFAGDSAGMRFVMRAAEADPDQVLMCADQLPLTEYYRQIIESVVLKDPDFAKRYFFNDHNVSLVTSQSKNVVVNDVYKLFDAYGTRSKAYVLYDAVEKKEITAREADTIAMNNDRVIRQLVKTLSTENPLAIKSLQREMDFRSVEWIRQSTLMNQEAINAKFSKFNAEEKLTLVVFGYRECNPRMLEMYLSLLRKADLSKVSAALIKNLSNGPLPSFLASLDKEQKLTGLLAAFNETDKKALTRMLSADEHKEEQPVLREIPIERGVRPTAALVKAVDIKPMAPVVVTAPVIKEAEPVEIAVEPIHIPLSDSARSILGLKRNIYMALQDIPSFIHKPYAKDALLYAAAVEPDEVFKKVDMYKGKYWSKEILEEATHNAPINARRYFSNSTHPVTVILSYSSDPVIKRFLKMSREAEYQSKPFLLFDDMARDSMSLKNAMSISSDNAVLFKELMSISARKSYLGKYNVENEMNYYALHFVRAINDKTGMADKIRFASVDDVSCDELYYLMVYGREEVFSSTFAGLFERFEKKCASSKDWNADHFTSYPHYRAFIALCATYNKLDKFLSFFSQADQRELLTAFASDLDKSPDQLSEAATVAETVANTTTPVVLQTLQNIIKASYLSLDSAKDYNGMSIYGILAAMCKDKAQTDKKWFATTAKQYRTGALTTLTAASLIDPKPFVERMYFYDDEDGRDSYQNFIRTFSASPNWKIEQNYSYVKISSVSGAKIEIYANKAELEEGGDKEISKIITDNNYVVKCIVHRGHSFHTEATLTRVPSTARVILVGSCGGFYKINMALRKAPDAFIISTRQIGIKQINDPIIYSFNEYVRQGRDINWKTFWDEMKVKVGSNSQFYDYVPPHKNLESLFVRAYYEIMGG